MSASPGSPAPCAARTQTTHTHDELPDMTTSAVAGACIRGRGLRTVAPRASWCHTGTMKRMNLREVPDDVYAALVSAAEDSRQSLSAFVVDRLSEVARAVRVADYVAAYPAPRGTGVTTDDAVSAVREIREAL